MNTIKTSEAATPVASAGASISRDDLRAENVEMHGKYIVQCLDKDGNVKWQDEIENLVTTVGKNDLLDKYLSGSAYTAAWFLGLVDNASFSAFNAADTMASHAGWLESTAYSNANRPTPSFNSASAGSKATTATAFTINATATINGVFLTSVNTKGGTTGILYSAGSFSGGNRAVVSGDTLNVTYTASA